MTKALTILDYPGFFTPLKNRILSARASIARTVPGEFWLQFAAKLATGEPERFLRQLVAKASLNLLFCDRKDHYDSLS
jgi:hypothetical protein